MILSNLLLDISDIQKLKITDAYSIHRIVYSLFDDTRSPSEKESSVSSGILYVVKGGDSHHKKILILSDRHPKKVNFGHIESKLVPESFLMHETYRFEITVNPTKRDKQSGKTVAIIGREEVIQWFIRKAADTHGFIVNPVNIQINDIEVNTFEKKGHKVTQGQVNLIGELKVTDRSKFIQSFQMGIGRGRAFGLGLLQIQPIS